ncbi:MAG: PIG-L deacetylase family protein [Acidimicrobiales bacterium]
MSDTLTEPPARILAVVAHPDDVDFGAAGTIASWTAAGSEVVYCVVTDGAAGSIDPNVDLSSLVETRQREQREAAKRVGVSEVEFLGYPDGRLEPTMEVRRDISRMIRTVRPGRVLTQSPERYWERIPASHPDHMAAGEATLRAVYPDARNPFAHPELLADGLEAFSVPEVWMMGSPRADRCVDTTNFFELKMAALSEHRSQLAGVGELDVRLRGWSQDTAQRFGLPDGRLAEAFHVINTA